MCLLEVPESLRSSCPYGRSLPHCRAGNVQFGQYCEANGLSDDVYAMGHVCGTHKEVNSCFGGFDSYVHVFCADTSPQWPPPPPVPPLSPPPPPLPPPLAPPPPPGLSPGLPLPLAVVATSTSQILAAACIPAGFLVLFCMALLVYRAVRRRSTARIEQEHRAYQAKLSDISSEYNSSVLYAVKSIATYAHGVEMSTVTLVKSAGARIGDSEDCAVCMETFKEGDVIKSLPCRHMVRPPPTWLVLFTLVSLHARLDVPTSRCAPPPALVAVPREVHRHVAAWQGPRATDAFVAPIWAADLPAVQGGADRSPTTDLAPSATHIVHGTRAPDCTRCGGLGLSSLVVGKLRRRHGLGLSSPVFDTAE